MDATLTVEELCFIVQRDERSVPDVRLQIEATTTVAPEGDEFLRCHIVPGRRQNGIRRLLKPVSGPIDPQERAKWTVFERAEPKKTR